ncbi:MAG: hypothetical protein JSS98_04425 [Bacteroidetes bacterium]|nr:hypothetical protein [Bacteroidota bacterium]
MAITQKIRFDKSGYYFMALVCIVLMGFWPSYFAKFATGTNKYPFYFHFHATMMSLWLLLLIVQPILIRKKKLSLHRTIGKLSYVIMPLLFLSVILLRHYQMEKHVQIKNNEKFYGPSLVVPFKDLFIIGIAYIIAIRYRHNVNIHARAMICTGIAFIEPPLIRFLNYAVFPGGDGLAAFFTTIGIIYSILIALIIIERKQRSGLWVFPLILGLLIMVHSIIYFQISIPGWETFARWFAALPLTKH